MYLDFVTQNYISNVPLDKLQVFLSSEIHKLKTMFRGKFKVSLLKEFINFDNNHTGLIMCLGVLIIYPVRMSKFYNINC